MTPLAEVCIRSVRFPGADRPALGEVAFSVEEGEFVVVAGPVGSGKSTLCHCLAGAIPGFYPAVLDGEVRVEGADIAGASRPALAGTIGFLTQDPQAQIVEGTVAEEVAFGPCNLELPAPEVRRRITAALEWVGLSGFAERDPRTLSGGEAQRTVLAGILALEPRLLVLDDPLAELDPPGRALVCARLRDLSRSGVGVVLATTRPDLVEGFDRLIWLGEGLCRSEARDHPSATSAPGTAGVRFEGCTHVYPGGRAACRDVSLTVAPGEIVGLIGENGSGKTTVAKHVNGLLRATEGSVLVDGLDPAGRDRRELRRRVGFVFQNPDFGLFADTVEEEVAFGPRVHGLGEEEVRRRVAGTLARVGLQGVGGLHPHRLSRGQRQLLAVAGVLATRPRILVADEPTAGLDCGAADLVLDGLRAVARGGGAVLLVSHDEELVAATAHRVAVMDRGRLRLAGTECGVEGRAAPARHAAVAPLSAGAR